MRITLILLLFLTLPLIFTQSTSSDQSVDGSSPLLGRSPPQWQNQSPPAQSENPTTDSQSSTAENSNQYEPEHKKKNKNKEYKNSYEAMFDPSRQNQPLPDDFIMFLIVFYGALLGIVLSICGCCLYFCMKKNAQSKKMKKRMQELQRLFAQSQNMNQFEMNAQPNFPRTIHI